MTEVTLRRYLTESGLDPNLIFLLEDIASSCRNVANQVRNGAFEGNLGSANVTNVQVCLSKLPKSCLKKAGKCLFLKHAIFTQAHPNRYKQASNSVDGCGRFSLR